MSESNGNDLLPHAMWLCSEAHDAMKRGEPECAIHRLVDAAGLCARIAKRGAEKRGIKFRAIGFTEQTGRGFVVIQAPSHPAAAKPKRKEVIK